MLIVVLVFVRSDSNFDKAEMLMPLELKGLYDNFQLC